MSEWTEQREAIAWFKNKWPQHEKAIRISSTGINLGGGKKAAMLINQAKAQGLVIGEADIAILLPRGGYGCLLIEHKAEDSAHNLSGAQVDYLEYHNGHGNCAVSTRGVDALKAVISQYMEGISGQLD